MNIKWSYYISGFLGGFGLGDGFRINKYWLKIEG